MMLISKKRKRKRPRLLAADYESLLKKVDGSHDAFEEKVSANPSLGGKDEEDGLRDLVRHTMFDKGQSKRIWGELYKVIDSSDVVVQVQECYELSAQYEGNHDPQKLEELGAMLTSLDAGDSIVVAKSFSHMFNLANLAEEVQIAYRRRIKLKKGVFTEESSATTESDIEETLKRLVGELNNSPQQVFDALMNQTVDLVFTAHPTQSVRRSLLQKHGRIRHCLAQLYAKDITPDDKQELDEALQREEKAEVELKQMRQNLGFKAKPMPDFYREPQSQKTPVKQAMTKTSRTRTPTPTHSAMSTPRRSVARENASPNIQRQNEEGLEI